MKLLANSIRFISLLVMFSGCTKMCAKQHRDMSPEEVVETYLNTALNMTNLEEREDLLNLTTDTLKADIAGASEQSIREAYIDRHYRVERYSVVQRRDRTPRETEITFELQFQDLGADSKQNLAKVPVTTVEKTVSVIRENQLWLISKVVGNKTSIEFPIDTELTITPDEAP